MSMKTINCIDFFAGIGAWEIASQIVNDLSGSNFFRTIQFVEIDPHAQKTLRSHFPNIPIHPDVRTYTPKTGEVDVYYTSFPCTGTSSAGKRTGLSHAESSLWYESLRCIVEGRPKFIVVEQPEGFIHRGLRAVLGGLRVAGYSWDSPQLISAAELGAPHQRNRVFVVAYRHDLSLEQRQGWCCWEQQVREHIAIAREIVACPQGARLKGQNVNQRRLTTNEIGYSQTQSGSVCLDDGISPWLDGISFNGWWRHNLPPVSPGLEGLSRKEAGMRRQCINLYGRSICPLQAAIALMRLKFLIDLI